MLLVRYLCIICISIYKIVSRDTRVCIIHTERWQVPQTFPSTKLSLGIQECVLIYSHTKMVGTSNFLIYKIVSRDTRVCIIHTQRRQVPQTFPSTKLSLGIQACILYTHKDGRYLKLTHLQNCLQRYKSVYSVQSRVRHYRDFCLSGAIEMVNWAKSGTLLFNLLRSYR